MKTECLCGAEKPSDWIACNACFEADYVRVEAATAAGAGWWLRAPSFTDLLVVPPGVPCPPHTGREILRTTMPDGRVIVAVEVER